MRRSRSPSSSEPDFVLKRKQFYTWATKTGLLAKAQHNETVRQHEEDDKASPEGRIHRQLITWIVFKARFAARLNVNWAPADGDAEAYVYLRDGTSLTDLKKFLLIDEVSLVHSAKDY
jgi:hypothetical protein